MKVLIVGGGVAGLASGWRLAEAGCTVEILERGIVGRASTWAAAGMLATAAETVGAADAHARLARESRALWPDFAASLERASGSRIDFRKPGSLIVAYDDARARALSGVVSALQANGERAVWLPPAEARAHEPGLIHEIAGALLAPDDAQVDNRVLGAALAQAFVRAGGIVREFCEAKRLHIADRVRGLATTQGDLTADCVVLAGGAWTSLIGGATEYSLPPIRPAKGQMMALTAPNPEAVPHHLLWSDDVYVVPRAREGGVFVGATVEDAGFDTSVDRKARDRLMQGALRLLPALAEWRIGGNWAGLRPRTPDSSPVLGPTAIPGLFMASGQFRNGILFAPAIAERLRRALFGEPPPPMADAFDPRRFAEAGNP